MQEQSTQRSNLHFGSSTIHVNHRINILINHRACFRYWMLHSNATMTHWLYPTDSFYNEANVRSRLSSKNRWSILGPKSECTSHLFSLTTLLFPCNWLPVFVFKYSSGTYSSLTTHLFCLVPENKCMFLCHTDDMEMLVLHMAESMRMQLLLHHIRSCVFLRFSASG